MKGKCICIKPVNREQITSLCPSITSVYHHKEKQNKEKIYHISGVILNYKSPSEHKSRDIRRPNGKTEKGRKNRLCPYLSLVSLGPPELAASPSETRPLAAELWGVLNLKLRKLFSGSRICTCLGGPHVHELRHQTTVQHCFSGPDSLSLSLLLQDGEGQHRVIICL